MQTQKDLEDHIEYALNYFDDTVLFANMLSHYFEKRLINENHQEYLNDFFKTKCHIFKDVIINNVKITANSQHVKYFIECGAKINFDYTVSVKHHEHTIYDYPIDDILNIIENTDENLNIHVGTNYELCSFLKTLNKKFNLVYDSSITHSCDIGPIYEKDDFYCMNEETKNLYFENRLINEDYATLDIMIECGFQYKCENLDRISEFNHNDCKFIRTSEQTYFLLKHTQVSNHLGKKLCIELIERECFFFDSEIFKKYDIHWFEILNKSGFKYITKLPEISEVIDFMRQGHSQMQHAFDFIQARPNVISDSVAINNKHTEFLIAEAKYSSIFRKLIVDLFRFGKLDLSSYTNEPWINKLVNFKRLARCKSACQ